jgi:hypothetical protein
MLMSISMRTSFSTARQVVALDWRLLISACRGHGPDMILPALLGALVLAASYESAVATASMLAGLPTGIASSMLAAFVWNACLASAVLTLAAGTHSTAERILRFLAPEPMTRRQTYIALVGLSLAGRHALVSGIVLVPLVCLLSGLTDPARAAGGMLAMLLVLRLVPGVTRCIAAMTGVVMTRLGIALVFVGITVLVLLPRPGFDAVVAALPPSLVVQYVVDSRSSVTLWALLAAWTIALGLIEYATLNRSTMPAKQPRTTALLPAIPGWIRGVARTAGLSAALLHGELLRLLRWRRFLIGWMVYAAVLALVLTRMPSLDSRVLPILLVGLGPPFVAAATLGNFFAPDRGGVQAFYLTLDEPHHAVTAKIVAVAIFAIVAEVITLCLVFAFVPKRWQLGDLYTPLMAVAFYLYVGSAGRITSTLFPVPTEPHAIGGGLLRGPGAALLLTLNGLGLVGIVAPPLSHDTRGISSIGLLVAGIGISILVAAAVKLSATMSNRAMSVRREQLIASLAQDSSPS